VGAINAAVGQDQDGVPLGNGLVGSRKEGVQCLLQSSGAVGCRKEHGKRGGFEAGLIDLAQLFELLVGEQRVIQFDHAGAMGTRLQQVGLGTQQGGRRGDQLFADRVDGRVGYLGKQLLEIVVEQLRLAGKRRQRCIGAHGAQRLYAVGRHGAKDHTLVLEGVAEGLLTLQDAGVVRVRAVGRFRQFLQQDMIFFQPLGVGLGTGQLLFDLFIGHDAPLLRINQEHVAGLQAPLVDDPLRLDGQNARLRGHDHQIIGGDVIA